MRFVWKTESFPFYYYTVFQNQFLPEMLASSFVKRIYFLYYYHVADKSIRGGGLFYIRTSWLNPMTGFLVSSVHVHTCIKL